MGNKLDHDSPDTTQTNQISQFFLDTNIILARVLEHHSLHRLCKQLLKTPVTKFTSESVRRELQKIHTRRRDYYGLLLAHKYQRKTDYKAYIEGLPIPKSDKAFLKQVQRFIHEKYRRADWYGMYRTHLDIINKEFTQCFQTEIEMPLVAQANDSNLFSEINRIIQNKADCQILLDMIVGLRHITNPLFFTTQDKKDYLSKQTDIQRWYEAYFQSPCFFQMGDIREALAHLL